MGVAQQYAQLRAELDEACLQVGRDPKSVLLLAVSKTVDVDAVIEAQGAGAVAFGENRPPELVRKHEALPNAQFHFIGNIQSRKIGAIVSASELIHSVSKEAHLSKIDTAAAAAGKVQRVLLEVNVSGEESKSGFMPEEVFEVVWRARALEHVIIEGLMTMAPRGNDEQIEYTFSGLSQLMHNVNSQLKANGETARLSELSMGMSEDWRVAVRYGATIIRVGRAIFSAEFEGARQ